MSTGSAPGADDQWRDEDPAAGHGADDSPHQPSDSPHRPSQIGAGESVPSGPGSFGQPPSGHGGPWQPGPYGQPPAGHGGPWQPGPYGQPPAGHGGPWQPGPYGQPPAGHGGPWQPGPYSQPPAGHGGPWQPGPYGQLPPVGRPPPWQPVRYNPHSLAGPGSYSQVPSQGQGGPWHAGPYGPPRAGAPGMYGYAPPPGPGLSGPGSYGAPQLDQQGQYCFREPIAPYSTRSLPGERRRKAWQLLALGTIVAVVAAAVAAYAITLDFGPSPRNTAAGSARSSAPPPDKASRPAPSAGPLVVGGDGNVAAPAQIGSLHFNPVLTNRYITGKLKQQVSDDFGSSPGGVVGGFYTSNPAAKSTSRSYQLWFDVAYLAGAGRPDAAVRSFLASGTLQSPAQIPAGPVGGKAACSWLQVKSGRLAHCMWVDKNTYADFYAWRSTRAALAKTMLAARPRIEIGGGGAPST